MLFCVNSHSWVWWHACIMCVCAGSPYRIPISSAILQLQEAGRLHILKNRWWKEKSGKQCNVSRPRPWPGHRDNLWLLCFICNLQEEMKKSANELSLDNVGGIFVVLLAGMGIACSIAVLGATQSTLSNITTITDQFTTATNIYTTNLPFISLHYLE